jgi:BirA family biotin operon repressor/biotin-[acetyl-CoA-carboxylase] ligase
VTLDELREVQANLVHRLGRADEPVALADLGIETTGPDDRALDLAIASLCAAGLVNRDDAGGLRLGPRTSALSADRTRAHRRVPGLGEPLEFHAFVASTNDLALEHSARSNVGRTIVAELQTAGRGRRARAFESPPGLGLWCSTILDAPVEPSRAGRLSLIVALAVAEAVEVSTNVRPLLKWPNDVRIGGRKVAGILIEARTSQGSVLPVAGVGINVHHAPSDFPEHLRDVAGSLVSMTGASVDRSRVLAAFLDALTRITTRERVGDLDLAATFATYDELRGREISILQGEEWFRGRADGLEDDGSLRVRTADDGLRIVHGGEATLSDAEE